MVQRFEGAGLDGVIAKPWRRLTARQRAIQDQARAHRAAWSPLPLVPRHADRSFVLLGLYNDGVCGNTFGVKYCHMAMRRSNADERPVAQEALKTTPAQWERERRHGEQEPGGRALSAGKDCPGALRPDALQVKYEQLQAIVSSCAVGVGADNAAGVRYDQSKWRTRSSWRGVRFEVEGVMRLDPHPPWHAARIASRARNDRAHSGALSGPAALAWASSSRHAERFVTSKFLIVAFSIRPAYTRTHNGNC